MRYVLAPENICVRLSTYIQTKCLGGGIILEGLGLPAPSPWGREGLESYFSTQSPDQ